MSPTSLPPPLPPPAEHPIHQVLEAPAPSADDFDPSKHHWDGTTWWTGDRAWRWSGSHWRSPADPEAAEPALQQQSLVTSDRAAIAVAVGSATVVALPILELIGVISGLGSCSASGFADVLLIAITIALAAGGASVLILASTSQSSSPQRALGRTLGIVAVVMAAVSVPVNVIVIGLTGFCVTG